MMLVQEQNSLAIVTKLKKLYLENCPLGNQQCKCDITSSNILVPITNSSTHNKCDLTDLWETYTRKWDIFTVMDWNLPLSILYMEFL